MRNFILCALAVLVLSGTAWAQTTMIGPDYFHVENTGSTGTVIILNPDYTVNKAPKITGYAISDEAKFYISGHRYINGAWTRVFPKGEYVSAITDTTVYWQVNLALPIYQQVDALCITSALTDGGVDLVVYTQ